MPIKIEINSQEINNKSGMGRNGQPYSINEQTAWLHTGGVYPERILIRLRDGQQPYPNGVYRLHPSSFYVGRFNSLEINPVLELVGDLPKAAAKTA